MGRFVRAGLYFASLTMPTISIPPLLSGFKLNAPPAGPVAKVVTRELVDDRLSALSTGVGNILRCKATPAQKRHAHGFKKVRPDLMTKGSLELPVRSRVNVLAESPLHVAGSLGLVAITERPFT